jgi:hypothetical protein
MRSYTQQPNTPPDLFQQLLFVELVYIFISIIPRLKLALGALTYLEELVKVAGPPGFPEVPWPWLLLCWSWLLAPLVPRGSLAVVPPVLVLVAGPPGFPEVPWP